MSYEEQTMIPTQKIVAAILSTILIINLVLLGTGRITPLNFWIVLAIIGAFSLLKNRQNKQKNNIR